MNIDNTIRVFVYGTLKREGSLHVALDGCEFVEDATLEGARMYNLGFCPAIVPSAYVKTDTVEGEVWLIDGATLQKLDRIEGHPTLYQRRREIIGGEPTWVYFLNSPLTGEELERRRITSGRWPVGGGSI